MKEVRKMNMPGFTAEVALYQSPRAYRSTASIGGGTAKSPVVPAIYAIFCDVWGCFEYDTSGASGGFFPGSGAGGGITGDNGAGGGGRGSGGGGNRPRPSGGDAVVCLGACLCCGLCEDGAWRRASCSYCRRCVG